MAKIPRVPVENQIITVSVVKIAIKFSPCPDRFLTSSQRKLYNKCEKSISFRYEKEKVIISHPTNERETIRELRRRIHVLVSIRIGHIEFVNIYLYS